MTAAEADAIRVLGAVSRLSCGTDQYHTSSGRLVFEATCNHGDSGAPRFRPQGPRDSPRGHYGRPLRGDTASGRHAARSDHAGAASGFHDVLAPTPHGCRRPRLSLDRGCAPHRCAWAAANPGGPQYTAKSVMPRSAASIFLYQGVRKICIIFRPNETPFRSCYRNVIS